MLPDLQSVRWFIDSLSLTNLADIGIMACLIYFVLLWFRGTRAFKILTTLVGIGIVYFVADFLGLVLTSLLFQYLWAVIIVILVIVFQPEIREMLDKASPIRFLSSSQANGIKEDILSETVRAVSEFSRNKIGALIVFLRSDKLDSLVLKGKVLDGVFSAEALMMIFQKSSPLHDGAVLVKNERIQAASCILPLSRNEELSSQYGTRHRAALGLSEKSDALCVLVSEETGNVSLVEGGKIRTYTKKSEFRNELERLLSANVSAAGPDLRHRVRDFLWSDIRFKLLSLIIAALLWVAVVGPKTSELGMAVPIQYTNLPQGMEITGKWMDKIDVRLRGPESGLSNLKPGAVRAVIDLSGALPGLNFYRITRKNIQVPVGIAISQIRPSDLTLHIETALFKRMSVMPNVVGNVPDKAVITISPPEVRIRAVQDVIKKIASVTTEPIQITDLISKGKVNVAVLPKPDGLKIDSVDPSDVTVSLRQDQP